MTDYPQTLLAPNEWTTLACVSGNYAVTNHGNPTLQMAGVLVGGSDDTNTFRFLKTDSTGALFVTGSLAANVVLPGSMTVTGTVALERGNDFVTPLFVTGSCS